MIEAGNELKKLRVSFNLEQGLALMSRKTKVP